MLFFSAVSSEALELLKEIQDQPFLKDFYLVGGTALALNFGHRVSVDLDFFTEKEFDTNLLVESAKENFPVKILSQAKNSLTMDVRSVKTDFIRHNYSLLNPIQEKDGIKIASVEDIAAMKFNSTMNRGSKKDFYDIVELLIHFSLEDLIAFHSKKYDFNSQLILLKSLVYFDDAELEPDPVSLRPLSWTSVKQNISDVVSKFTKI